MTALILLIATAAVGIESGWEPLPEGGHEYLIQLEPEIVDLLRKETDEITSDVPPHINVRRYRIFVGRGKLPRVDGPSQPAAEPGPPRLPESEPSRHVDAPQTEPELPAVPDFNNDPEFRSPETTPPAAEQRRTAAHPEVSLPPPPDETPHHPAHADAPGHLGHNAERAEPLAAASFNDTTDASHSGKPRSSSPRVTEEEQPRPWWPLAIASVLLCCSLAANVYLAWIAWEARLRYRDAAARLRALPAG